MTEKRSACSRLAVACAAVVAASITSVPAFAAGPHGEMPVAEQLVALEKILPLAKSLDPPRGVDPELWRSLWPKDNQPTMERITLGKKLYFDPRLSADGTVACATCHDISRGLTDLRNASEGIGGKVGRRNSPTTANAAFFQSQFLDGRAPTLEEQAKLPIINPIEMGMPDAKATVAAIEGDAEYQRMFQAAYGRPVNFDDLARAIGAFERTLVFLDAPFDAFLAGDAGAISEDARAGWTLFLGKGRCQSCHQLSVLNPIGTNDKFHNIGVSARAQNFEKLALEALKALETDPSMHTIDRLALETDLSELGRFVITRNRSDIGAFKTSQLRNVGVTAPYMHDGSMATLWDVIDHYNRGGEANPFLDGGIQPLALTDQEVDQLVAFLFVLTDRRFADQNAMEQKRQQGLAAKNRPFKEDNLASRRVFPFEQRISGSKK